jgi:hypothetical protein
MIISVYVDTETEPAGDQHLSCGQRFEVNFHFHDSFLVVDVVIMTLPSPCLLVILPLPLHLFQEANPPTSTIQAPTPAVEHLLPWYLAFLGDRSSSYHACRGKLLPLTVPSAEPDPTRQPRATVKSVLVSPPQQAPQFLKTTRQIAKFPPLAIL